MTKVCVDCGKNAEFNRVRCKECLSKNNKSSKKRKGRLKDNGQCLRCNKKAEIGTAHCSECACKNNKNNKVRRKTAKKEGECADSCGRKAEKNKVRCRKCLIKDTKRTKLRVERLKREGRCISCGKQIEYSRKGALFCTSCTEGRKIHYLKRYANHFILGICVNCSNEAELGKIYCRKCADRDNKRHKIKQEKHKEEGRCVSCGRNLDLIKDGGCIKCATCSTTHTPIHFHKKYHEYLPQIKRIRRAV